MCSAGRVGVGIMEEVTIRTSSGEDTREVPFEQRAQPRQRCGDGKASGVVEGVPGVPRGSV